MKNIAILLMAVALFTTCKKSESPSTNNDTDYKGNIKSAIIYTNITDVRLAEIETVDSKKIIFFGERSASGEPIGLTGYSIASINDPSKYDLVLLNKRGEFSKLILKTGEMLQFVYTSDDTLRRLIISGPDSVSNDIIVRKSIPNKFKDLVASKSPNLYNTLDRIQNTSSNTSNEKLNLEPNNVTGQDKNINVKVQRRNKVTQSLSDVKNDETTVEVNINAGLGRNYYLPASYNIAKGIYSIPISSFGSWTDPQAADKTIKYIQEILNDACGIFNGPTDITLSALIQENICPIPHPYAKAICIANISFLTLCATSGLIDFNEVNKVVQKIDPNSIMTTQNAQVIVTSKHSKHGTVVSSAINLAQILVNPGTEDFVITHDYSPKFSLNKIAGDNQTGTKGSALPNPLEVLVLDEYGPVKEVNVLWSNITGGGSTGSNSSLTDANGVAKMIWTLGDKVDQSLEARVIDAAGKVIGPIKFNAKVDTSTCFFEWRWGAPPSYNLVDGKFSYEGNPENIESINELHHVCDIVGYATDVSYTAGVRFRLRKGGKAKINMTWITTNDTTYCYGYWNSVDTTLFTKTFECK